MDHLAEIDNDDIVRAYALLLERPTLDIEQFSAELGYGTEATREILAHLASMSLVSRSESSGRLVAVSPLYAMQQLLTQERNLLEARQEFLRVSHETLCHVLPSYAIRSIAPGVLTEQIHDLPSARRRMEELTIAATSEILSLCPAASNPTATYSPSRQLDLAALSRGVRMRAIYLDSIAYDTGALAYRAELIEAGGEVRVSSTLPTRLAIVDGKTAVVPMSLLNSIEGCLIIHHRGTVTALGALFESYWQNAVKLFAQPESGRDCTVTEHAILRLLASGAKDGTIARQLGLSVRTVRRCIADLMSRAGASSRFELAVRAVASGWL